MRINNNNFQKNSNISRVVETIWHKQTISRVDIARELKLYRSTVSNIINSLISNNFVLETEEGESLPQGGRKPIFLSVNQNFGSVIGLEIQPNNYNAVAVNLFGEILFSCSGDIPEPSTFHNTFNPETAILSIIDKIISKILPKIKELKIPPLALCFAMPGIIDTTNGIIIKSTPFNLNNYHFLDVFDMRYGIPVLIENDANCCAWFDLTQNRQNELKNFTTVLAEYHYNNNSTTAHSGIGIGLAIVIEGRVRYGNNYSMGEYYSLSWRDGFSSQTGLSEKTILSVTTDSNSFEEWITDLFTTLSPLTPLIAPERFILHGEVFSDSLKILSIINKRIPQFSTMLHIANCNLEFSRFTKTQIAEGAASMFLQKLFSVPDLNETNSILRFDWDSIFALAAK